jgi:hypothetical protein
VTEEECENEDGVWVVASWRGDWKEGGRRGEGLTTTHAPSNRKPCVVSESKYERWEMRNALGGRHIAEEMSQSIER